MDNQFVILIVDLITGTGPDYWICHFPVQLLTNCQILYGRHLSYTVKPVYSGRTPLCIGVGMDFVLGVGTDFCTAKMCLCYKCVWEAKNNFDIGQIQILHLVL